MRLRLLGVHLLVRVEVLLVLVLLVLLLLVEGSLLLLLVVESSLLLLLGIVHCLLLPLWHPCRAWAVCPLLRWRRLARCPHPGRRGGSATPGRPAGARSLLLGGSSPCGLVGCTASGGGAKGAAGGHH